MRSLLTVALLASVVLPLLVIDAPESRAHELPEGTPRLAGPLTPDEVQARMAHIAWHNEWEAMRAELEQINGPYRSARASAPRTPGKRAVRPVAVEQWRPLVEQHFPPGWVEWALRIMQCESGGDPGAKNPRSSASGLFQFLSGTWEWVTGEMGTGWSVEDRFDGAKNIAAAAWLLENGGTSHWACKARR